jgi:signal peptidase I
LAEIRWVDSVEPEPVVAEDLPFDAPVRAATPPAPAASVTPEQDLIGARVSDVAPSHQVVPPAAEPDPIRVDPVQAPLVNPSPQPTELLPENVGRSAWDDQLAIDDGDPDGWDKLSWQDLDDDGDTPGGGVQQPSVTGQLIREWGPVLFAAIAIALFTRLVLVQAYHIPSGSMIPTLEDGDRVVVNRLSYRLGEIERGQVVVFAKPQGTAGENDLIKRVIGLPGETIQFVDNEVYVDGFRVDEPYLAQQDSTRPRLTIPGCGQPDPASDLCEIPEGHVFVMGDNRLGSSDSRVFGPIETESIVGRAFMRVWPLNNLGQL